MSRKSLYLADVVREMMAEGWKSESEARASALRVWYAGASDNPPADDRAFLAVFPAASVNMVRQ